MFYLLALPLAAVLFYAIVFSLGLQWRTNWILYQLPPLRDSSCSSSVISA